MLNPVDTKATERVPKTCYFCMVDGVRPKNYFGNLYASKTYLLQSSLKTYPTVIHQTLTTQLGVISRI